eukprot:2525763-Rhodomonas_salina.2
MRGSIGGCYLLFHKMLVFSELPKRLEATQPISAPGFIDVSLPRESLERSILTLGSHGVQSSPGLQLL